MAKGMGEGVGRGGEDMWMGKRTGRVEGVWVVVRGWGSITSNKRWNEKSGMSRVSVTSAGLYDDIDNFPLVFFFYLYVFGIASRKLI